MEKFRRLVFVLKKTYLSIHICIKMGSEKGTELVHKPELQKIGSSLYHYLAYSFIQSCSELSTRNLMTFSLTVHMV